MDPLVRMKLYLNIPLEDESKDMLLEMLYDEALYEVAQYTNREVEWIKEHPVGQSASVKAAVVKYNRRGTEGMKSQSFAGSSESFAEGLTAEIRAQLNSIKKVKLI